MIDFILFSLFIYLLHLLKNNTIIDIKYELHNQFND